MSEEREKRAQVSIHVANERGLEMDGQNVEVEYNQQAREKSGKCLLLLQSVTTDSYSSEIFLYFSASSQYSIFRLFTARSLLENLRRI